MIKRESNIYVSENVLELDELLEVLKEEGSKTIGLCTGSFDLLHPGHVSHLISAKNQCDLLVVAVAKDAYSSSKNSGTGRPVFSEYLRAFMVSQLKPVDYVVFDSALNYEVIEKVRPDVYIKGIDYVGSEDPTVKDITALVDSWGGRMYSTLDEKFSTSEIIDYIKREIFD